VESNFARNKRCMGKLGQAGTHRFGAGAGLVAKMEGHASPCPARAEARPSAAEYGRSLCVT
jgi:hypothetical protein